MTPDQATIILENVGLPTANAEHPVTKRVIGAIPPNKVDYRPDDIVKSAIDLAWHIVTAEVRVLIHSPKGGNPVSKTFPVQRDLNSTLDEVASYIRQQTTR